MRSIAGVLLLVALTTAEDEGVFIGALQNYAHGVGGKLYAVNESTLIVKNFKYDGQGPDAFFWVGTTGAPGNVGTILPHPFEGKFYEYSDEKAPVLKGFFDGSKDINLTLPDDLSVSNLKWLSVWCRQYSVNFGDLIFPDNFSLDSTTIPTVSSTTTTKTTTTDLPPPIVYPENTLDDADSDDSDVQAEPESEPDHHDGHRARHGGAANIVASTVAIVASYILAKFLL